MTPRLASVLTLAVALSGAATPAAAVQDAGLQDPMVASADMAMLPVPFGVGERLEYDVKFGSIKAGEGLMEVRGIEEIRGRPAYHTYFLVKGGAYPRPRAWLI